MFGGSPSRTPPADQMDALRRIEGNTADLVRWMRYLTGAVILLVIVTVLLFV